MCTHSAEFPKFSPRPRSYRDLPGTCRVPLLRGVMAGEGEEHLIQTRLGHRDRFQRDVAVMQRRKERRCLTWVRERAGDLAGFEMYRATGSNAPKFVHRSLRAGRLGEFQAKSVSAHFGF